MTQGDERTYVEAARRESRAALEAMGENPYAYRFDRTHQAGEIAVAPHAGGNSGFCANRHGRSCDVEQVFEDGAVEQEQ